MSLKSHALHHISIITVLSCILDVYNWLCAGMIGFGWTHDAIYFACHMFMHFPCIHTPFQYTCYIWIVLELFWLSFFALPLFLLTLVMSMAPKRKSTPTQNPLRSGVSSSSNSAHISLRFRDDDAHKAFSENFSRHSIHSKRQVIMANFTNTDLPNVIHSQGWESLCDDPVTCPLVLIQKFYSNIHGIDRSISLFLTRILGTCIPVTPQVVANVLQVPRVEFLDYLSCEHL